MKVTTWNIYLFGNNKNTCAMKKLSTPNELKERLRLAFKTAYEKWLSDKNATEKRSRGLMAERLEVDPSYVSNVISGVKGLGDDVIDRIDKALPGWRDVAAPEAQKLRLVDSVINSQPQDAFLETILYCYKGLSAEHKEVIAMLANRLHDIDQPSDRKSKPWADIIKSYAKQKSIAEDDNSVNTLVTHTVSRGNKKLPGKIKSSEINQNEGSGEDTKDS